MPSWTANSTVKRQSAFLSCMVLGVLILSRGFVRARAWSVPTTPLLYRTSSSGKRVTCLSASSSNQEDEDKSPTTGEQNQTDASSAFWKKSSERTNGLSRQQQQRTVSSSSDEPRTGWLHNTAPKEGNTAATDSTESLSPAQLLLQEAKMKQELNHRIINPPAFHACGDGRQVVVTEHVLSLPVYREEESSPRLDVYFTITECVTSKHQLWWQSLLSMSPQQRADAYVEHASMKMANDMILYLQGGPGFGAAAPMVGLSMSADASWAGKALSHYKRIVLMDQRGTGRSTPITKQTLEKRFPDLFLLDYMDDDSHSKTVDDFETSYPDEARRTREAVSLATDFMAQFRADNIVQDAEAIRDALLLPTDEKDKARPWGAALGQSFGGFCVMTYLSQVDHPPKICLLTGGIAPMLTPTYDAYTSLWQRVKERSLQYYEMYPGDIRVVKRIIRTLLEKPAILPSGGKLTARRFLSLGLGLGGSPSSFASLHSLFATAFVSDNDLEFTRAFLKRIDSEQSFDDNPIYFFMHESIYGDGPKNSPTDWAAYRAYEDLIKTPSEFDYRLTSAMDSDARPTLFWGEMVFPWMAEGDFAEVSGLGMRSLAQSLAKKEDWGPLYDGDHMRKVLEDESISRAAAAVYLDDMYVDFNACMKVTKRGGPLEKCKVWVSNEYQHSGLRDDGAKIFEKLHGMATGSIRTPS